VLPRLNIRSLSGWRCILLAAVSLSACVAEPPADPTPTPDVRVPAIASDRASRPDGEPWMILSPEPEDAVGLMNWIHRLGGYLQVVVAGADPPIEDTSSILLFGELNPSLKLRDVDGDGQDDVVAEIPSLRTDPDAPGDGLILLFGTDALEGTEADVGLVVFDLRGNQMASAWTGRRTLAPTDEPWVWPLGPLSVPAASRPCDNGVDEDGDGWTDRDDPDCQPGGPQLESGTSPMACNDGLDNDGDGSVDAADPDCRTAVLLSEQPECDNGIDDDGDGWFDAADPDCAAAEPQEAGTGSTPCNDGLDNDGDGRIDRLDTACSSAESSED